MTRMNANKARHKRCAAECAVRFEPVCANIGFFATSTKCFRAGLALGKWLISNGDRGWRTC
jgi:hypothetical protein